MVTTLPSTRQMPGVSQPKATGKPDEALAEMVN
jgi:hypothetical protein